MFYSDLFSGFRALQRENNEHTLLLVFAPLSEFLVSYDVYTKQTPVFAVAKSVEANTSLISQSKQIASSHRGTGE